MTKILRLFMAMQVALLCAMSGAEARMSFDGYGSGRLYTPSLRNNRRSVALGDLTLSATSGTKNVPFNAVAQGKYAGSTLALGGTGSVGLSIAGSSISGTPTGFGPIDVIESLPSAANSPKTSTAVASIADTVGTVLSAVTLAPIPGNVGTSYTGTISGRTNGSTLSLTGPGAAGLSVNSTTAQVTGTLGAAGAINVVETLAEASNSPRITTAAATVPSATLATARANFGVLGASRQAQNVTPIYSDTGTPYTRIITKWCGHAAVAQFYDPRIRMVGFMNPDPQTDAYTAPTGSITTNGLDGFVAGRDGTGIEQMRTRIPKLLDSDVEWVLYDPSVANVSNDTRLEYVTKTQETFNLLKAGTGKTGSSKRAIYFEGLDRGVAAASPWKEGQPGHALIQQAAGDLVSWAGAQSPPIPVMPTRSYFLTTSPGGTTTTKDEYIRAPGIDDTHFSAMGGEELAVQGLLPVIRANIPAIAPFDPTLAGNLVSNIPMDGADGTVPASFVAGSVVPTGYAATVFSAPTAAVSTAIVTVNGKRMVEVTIDRSTMPTDGVARSEKVFLRAPHSALAANKWWVGRFRTEFDGGNMVRALYGKVTNRAASESLSGILFSVNPGGTPSDGPDAMPLHPRAKAGWHESMPIKFGAVAANVGALEAGIAYDRGDGSTLKVRWGAFELREETDPRTLMYDETIPGPAHITSANAYTVPEESDYTFTLAADTGGTWSMVGGDTAQFVAPDKFGVTRLLKQDYDIGTRTVAGTFRLTPRNPAIAPVDQTVTFTITDINDGYVDSMAGRSAGELLDVVNPNWTLITPSASTPGVQYAGPPTGGTNGMKLLAGDGLWFAPKQGDTVEQRVSATLGVTSNNSGLLALLVIDRLNFLALTNWVGTTFTVSKRSGGSASPQATFTAWKSIVSGDKIKQQIRQTSPGVYKLEFYQNDVKLPVATGSDDVTSLVTGALATARRSGVGGLNTNQGVSWIRFWQNQTSAEFISKIYLKTLTWENGTANLTATSGTGRAVITPRTGNSDIALGTITPALPAGATIFADGDYVAWDGVPMGGNTTYAVQVIETNTDPSVAAPTTKTTTLNITFP